MAVLKLLRQHSLCELPVATGRQRPLRSGASAGATSRAERYPDRWVGRMTCTPASAAAHRLSRPGPQAVTLLLEQGINVKYIAEMLDHARIAITLDLCSHATPTMQRQAVAAKDALVSGLGGYYIGCYTRPNSGIITYTGAQHSGTRSAPAPVAQQDRAAVS
jgi:hypothetical protein